MNDDAKKIIKICLISICCYFFLLFIPKVLSFYGIEYRALLFNITLVIKILFVVILSVGIIISLYIIIHNKKALGKKHSLWYIESLLIISLIIESGLIGYEGIFEREKEAFFYEKYLKVYSCSLFDEQDIPIGIYKPLNPFFRKKVTPEYKMDELLQDIYGMKFSIIYEEDNSLFIVPDKYPQLKVSICNPYTYQIDMSDQLLKWYIEEEIKDGNFQTEVIYKKENALAEDIAVVKISTGNLESCAKDVYTVIQKSSEDDYFINNPGRILCLITQNEQEKYITFTFGDIEKATNHIYNYEEIYNRLKDEIGSF